MSRAQETWKLRVLFIQGKHFDSKKINLILLTLMAMFNFAFNEALILVIFKPPTKTYSSFPN